jgi:hypothetical protein
MTLKEWDEQISPKLSGIRADAQWIRNYARSIKERVKLLPKRPAWQTQAISDVTSVIMDLKEAIGDLIEAQELYKDKDTAA